MQSSAQDGPVFHMCVTMCACGAGCIVASSLLIFAGLLDCTLDRSVLGVYQTLPARARSRSLLSFEVIWVPSGSGDPPGSFTKHQ